MVSTAHKLALLLGGGLRINYLLRDEFPVDQAAPVASPYSEGFGDLILDSSLWEIDGGVLQPEASATSVPLPLARMEGIPRAAGLALKVRLARGAVGAGPNELISPAVGWGTSGGATYSGTSGVTFTASQLALVESGATGIQTGIMDLASDTFADFVVILRDSGAFAVIDNQLVGIGGADNTATMFPKVWQVDANRHTPRIDRFVVGKLNGIWSDSYGIVTQRLAGARSLNDTFVHEAGAQWLLFTLTTLPSAGSMTVDFRVQDANNKWQLEVTSAGAFNLNEVVAGTPTTRATIASNQAGDRLKVVMAGSRARLQRHRSGASTQSALYSSVSTFTTQTDGEITSLGTGGAVSDLTTYPVNLSGSALAWVQAL